MADLTAQPLTVKRWKDLETLFGLNGACGGCWCMFFHQNTREYAQDKGDANRRALKKRVAAGIVPGLIGYRDGEPVAWVAIEPRKRYKRLMRSRKLLPAEHDAIWSAPCFYVKRGFRDQGLARRMLRAATEHARRKGAKIVEGYPVDLGKRTPAAFAYPGVASTFHAAGFKEVARRSATRPIMRKTLEK